MSLLTLPMEIRMQIFSECVEIEPAWYELEDQRWGIHYNWRYRWSEHRWRVTNDPLADHEYWEEEEEPASELWLALPGFNVEALTDPRYVEIPEEPTSELWQAMAEIDVRALTVDERRKNAREARSKPRVLSLLYVCWQLYREVIPLIYGRNEFRFYHPYDLTDFANNAWANGSLHLIKGLTIEVDLWGEPLRGTTGEASPGEDWQAWLEQEDRGLLWHFPDLEWLEIQFVEGNRHWNKGPVHYADEAYYGLNGHRPAADKLEDFRETLRRTVWVKQGWVSGLGYVKAREVRAAMMGVEVESSTLCSRDCAARQREERAGYDTVRGLCGEPPYYRPAEDTKAAEKADDVWESDHVEGDTGSEKTDQPQARCHFCCCSGNCHLLCDYKKPVYPPSDW